MMDLLKIDKIRQYKTRQGFVKRIVQEHYLREDVPCNSELCLAGCRQTANCVVPADVTHYLLPDCQTASDYLDILELPELIGIVFLQTVLHHVRHSSGKRSYQRLYNKVKDMRSRCTVFANEFCHYAYCSREPGEDHVQWQFRVVYESAVWYYNHLAGQKPIVLLTENEKVIEEYGSKTAGVYVLSIGNYLNMFWPDLNQALDIYESLKASLAEVESQSKGSSKEYTEYLPMDVLSAGIKSGRYIDGAIRVNRHHAQEEAFVSRNIRSSDQKSDVLIAGRKNRNRAVDGDIVVVELLPQAEWTGRIISLKAAGSDDVGSEKSESMPCGRVVGILQRNWRDYVVSLPDDLEQQTGGGQSDKILVIPWDYSIPKIRISTRHALQLKDQRIVVRIDSWETDSMFPNGHFVRSLGTIGDLETEIAAVLVEKNLSVGPFSEGLLKEMPENTEQNPWVMDEDEVKKRRDLRRSHLIFSIDPKGCEDVDDTLSVRKLKNGRIELGVHIADVTYFVKPDSLTDLEARSRSTTVYLADRRYDMLPEILSAQLCSLIGGVDRYAVSVIWQLDPNTYEVIKVWYGRTVIRSAYKMFYEAAQSLHDGKQVKDDIPELDGLDAATVDKKLVELKWCVDKLMDIARHLKARRVVGGAVQLEGEEVKVELNEEQEIEDLVPKQTMEIHETIAECMIFANHWVAKKIAEAFSTSALLRHHPLPRQDQFQELLYCAKAKGYRIDTSSNKALADSLDKCVDSNDPLYNRILRSLATKAMSNALYFSTGSLPRDQFFHYGLALDRYTHFTSPIRRYADVIVHRQLLAAVEEEDSNNLHLPSNKDLQQLSGHINTKHRASQNAQRDSQVLFQAMYFRDRDSTTDERCIVDAVVHNLRANGLLVFIPRYGIKGALYLKDKEGLVCDASSPGKTPTWVPGTLEWSEFSITVSTSTSKTTFKLFDHFTVRLSVQQARSHASSLRFDLVANQPHKKDESIGVQNTSLKTDIIQEVLGESEDKTSTASIYDNQDILGADFPELKKQYGQTNESVSLYHLLQHLQEMGLEESADGS
ncbi:LOW QUALITY PROTEIN: DIS3-like exonuclease 1 [Amphiura filiformis]|uniref:LOW QUALITY PROTEIN: DIS3-like exonuclease 1 n=1 Tax=Amphiura filiformis TaxID=82378 RepID=UPI003B20E896